MDQWLGFKGTLYMLQEKQVCHHRMPSSIFTRFGHHPCA